MQPKRIFIIKTSWETSTNTMNKRGNPKINPHTKKANKNQLKETIFHRLFCVYLCISFFRHFSLSLPSNNLHLWHYMYKLLSNNFHILYKILEGIEYFVRFCGAFLSTFSPSASTTQKTSLIGLVVSKTMTNFWY